MAFPRLIDGLQFARSASQVQGTLAGGQLPRLVELGCHVRTVHFTIAGGTGSKGRPSLRLQASAQVQLVCQRCLGPFAASLSVDTELELSSSALEIAQADDDVDRVLATPAMDVAGLVEDELILGLPQAPKHEHCAAAGSGETRPRSSPFEALSRLKQGR